MQYNKQSYFFNKTKNHGPYEVYKIPSLNDFQRNEPGFFLTQNKKWLYIYGGQCSSIERLKVDFLQDYKNEDQIIIPLEWKWEVVEFKGQNIL